jgi:hypothetical protein
MAYPKSVKNAMQMLGMKKGDNVNTVVKKNEKALANQNKAVKNFNNKVYENKLKVAAEEKKAVNSANVAAYNKQKEKLNSVANIVRKYENIEFKNAQNKGTGNSGNTMVKKMARNYNAKVKA